MFLALLYVLTFEVLFYKIQGKPILCAKQVGLQKRNLIEEGNSVEIQGENCSQPETIQDQTNFEVPKFGKNVSFGQQWNFTLNLPQEPITFKDYLPKFQDDLPDPKLGTNIENVSEPTYLLELTEYWNVTYIPLTDSNVRVVIKRNDDRNVIYLDGPSDCGFNEYLSTGPNLTENDVIRQLFEKVVGNPCFKKRKTSDQLYSNTTPSDTTKTNIREVDPSEALIQIWNSFQKLEERVSKIENCLQGKGPSCGKSYSELFREQPIEKLESPSFKLTDFESVNSSFPTRKIDENATELENISSIIMDGEQTNRSDLPFILFGFQNRSN